MLEYILFRQKKKTFLKEQRQCKGFCVCCNLLCICSIYVLLFRSRNWKNIGKKEVSISSIYFLSEKWWGQNFKRWCGHIRLCFCIHFNSIENEKMADECICLLAWYGPNQGSNHPWWSFEEENMKFGLYLESWWSTYSS